MVFIIIHFFRNFIKMSHFVCFFFFTIFWKTKKRIFWELLLPWNGCKTIGFRRLSVISQFYLAQMIFPGHSQKVFFCLHKFQNDLQKMRKWFSVKTYRMGPISSILDFQRYFSFFPPFFGIIYTLFLYPGLTIENPSKE